ncbi:hypothetical protein OH807_02375 [Kitasatospora sp. NBC_01560]|uniref:hypothetical protein n=1 Tax=Kitasatospora sp. NBC_01560 TaxID=2975965 RepID=UPI00386DC47E
MCQLHLVASARILSDPDGHEDEARAELSLLAEELKKIDPPAFDGCTGFIWAEFLDRWLW